MKAASSWSSVNSSGDKDGLPPSNSRVTSSSSLVDRPSSNQNLKLEDVIGKPIVILKKNRKFLN